MAYVLPSLLFGAQVLASQPQPTAFPDTLESPFTFVATAEVHPTGRQLLVADPREGLIRVIDWDRALEDTIAAHGQGPGEFLEPTAAFWLTGDSLLVVDAALSRISVLSVDNRDHGRSHLIPASLIPRWIRGLDGPDGIVGLAATAALDSLAIVRWKVGTASVDTLTMISGPRTAAATVVTENGRVRNTILIPVPFSGGDAWGIWIPGSVGVARVDPYRGEWLMNNETRFGTPITHRPVEVTSADREAWREARGVRLFDPTFEWPEEKSPIADDRILVEPSGAMWVPRSTAFGEHERYDVISFPEGELAKTVHLMPGTKLVAVDADYLYATYQDDVGLVWLMRRRR